MTTAVHIRGEAHTAIDDAEADSFDLYELIREALATSPQADPHFVVNEVFKAIPDEERDDTLKLCLHRVVLDIVRQQRNVRSRGRTSSPRWNAAAAVQRRLQSRVEVGDDERDWRFLADCTCADLLRAASRRRELAAASIAKAEEFERLAEVMAEHSVDVVSDLPLDVLTEVLS